MSTVSVPRLRATPTAYVQRETLAVTRYYHHRPRNVQRGARPHPQSQVTTATTTTGRTASFRWLARRVAAPSCRRGLDECRGMAHEALPDADSVPPKTDLD